MFLNLHEYDCNFAVRRQKYQIWRLSKFELFNSFVRFKTVRDEWRKFLTRVTSRKSSLGNKKHSSTLLFQRSLPFRTQKLGIVFCFDILLVWELNFCFQPVSDPVTAARSLVTLPCRVKTVRSGFWTSADLFPELHKTKKCNLPKSIFLSPNGSLLMQI